MLEPALPGGALKTARKGCGEFELTVHGVAAHAGLDPGKGASAIHELAAQIAAIERLQDLPRGISVNVGIVSGGSRPNVVAEEARATIDVRAPTRETAEAVEAAFRALHPGRPGTRLTIRGGFERPPMERTAAVAASLRPRVRSGLLPWTRPRAKGRPAAGRTATSPRRSACRRWTAWAPSATAPTRAHEHVDVTALPWRAALVAGLLASLR